MLLGPAFAWTCPSCGLRQYEDAVFIEITPEDQEYLKSEYGIVGTSTGQWLGRPDDVTCGQCAREYAAICPEELEMPGSDEDEIEDEDDNEFRPWEDQEEE